MCWSLTERITWKGGCIYLKQSINPKMSQALTFCFVVRHEDYFYGYGACSLRGFELGSVFVYQVYIVIWSPRFVMGNIEYYQIK